ncbi:helix-turn-helix transcriptional regulator [Streptomyces acidiscabies]|uniref:Helix-turn-helix transcriptional regulator n=1 Tax=Streptomyces acidiscabies TaxID=42234 RepID=A0AAP6BH94_9ACTN|nr:helix-turn-helix transcriptional regulator [Streptomyces acidiscabies]MBZ3918067.1 helix-turn-helix domain-containing protein [Streptomyces acidiscabies]MDX2964689.1 helix-turn-helix transcriptional regulator [Streptomyces acidiscabies]MDX3021925.1 helix-turn-helix transcriptional regulator [Streptomyces acidiscabies]MDX3789582.1 helix-turn-helix transcriptional regulator [Streptomyces acidiscabies]GAQ50567.1 helix-turn-helix protein [Streptomyces acidiscabies]
MDDLAGFLRTRRSRVDPAASGIPVDRRRRVAGLRREEVAHLSGVSVDYYVRLEQGRATQPSEQVLDALARVLGLDETEQEHLHRLAHQPRRRTKAPSGRVRPELLRVLDLVTDAPAFILDHRLNTLAGNRLAGLLYGRPVQGLNTARHIFLEEKERGLYADWEKCTLDVVGHLRLAAGQYPDDPRLASLIGELSMGSERFRRLWARADVRARTHGRKAYHHPLVGLLELHQENFALPDASGMEMIVLSAPPDSAAEDGLRLLAGLGAAADERPGRVRPLP